MNDSKKILDDPASSATAQQQKQAFCARYHAYKNIAEISEHNPKPVSCTCDVNGGKALFRAAAQTVSRLQV